MWLTFLKAVSFFAQLAVFLPLSFCILQQAPVHCFIYFTAFNGSPSPSSLNLSSLPALRCVIYESACWPVNVSPSILCSAPSELIRLWRAIYPPLKKRESANFSSSLSFCLTAITYGCLFLKVGCVALSAGGEWMLGRNQFGLHSKVLQGTNETGWAGRLNYLRCCVYLSFPPLAFKKHFR